MTRLRPVRFARRTAWPTALNEVADQLQARRQRGEDVMDLTESNPTRCGLSGPGDLGAALLSAARAGYDPSPRGLFAAREAVSGYYREQGITVDPQRIFLTASTSEAYSFLFRLLADPGDEVLFPAPSYPLFQFLVDLNDLESGHYPLIYDAVSGWRVDGALLSGKLSGGARALVLVNPNNPTGSSVSSGELSLIHAACRRAGVPVICDEVFLDYTFNGAPGRSLAARDEVLTFVMGGLSKTLALPQMKLSWIVVNGPREEVTAAMARLEVIADTYLSVNTPVQQALPSWLARRAEIQAPVLERVRANRAFLEQAFRAPETGLCLKAEAGWYAVIRLPDSVDEEALAVTLLREDGVYVHPGYFFDFSDGPHLVLSLLPPPEVMARGTERILRRLR